ncbi:major facilitator superfamily (MFS) transporter [Arthrobacter crystallopoietes BAB-32]|uniref:Major facilitator superfamily (MFS) transporter n=1 Tax=Arthrobacter crystallopoietes BAB-32 TaxID=1246476 RepID=N1V6Q7_9MICC|nr:MFS transporter [Arthrobacter crystallopoietes]EMY35777.1 major facilitator superfamily (MFS) transporter [Arthrobacter crystallopoietes BAB-32]
MPKLLADTAPLKESPDFRRMWVGTSLSSIGAQLTLVAVSLEVYELTRSTFAVGALGIVGLVPLVLAGLYGGAIVDAHDRRKVALYSGLVLWSCAGLFAVHAWSGIGQVWLLYVLIAIHSAAAGVNQPARNAIIPRLVRLEMLPAANALNMMTFGLGMTIGPLLAGVLVANVGFGWTYTVDVVTFTAAIWALFRLPPVPPEGDVRKAGLHSVLEGLKFLRTKPNIRMTFLVDLAAMVLAQPRALMPAIGAVVLGGGEATAGLLLASVAAGAFLAALFSGPLGQVRRQGLAVLWCVALWGTAIAVFGTVVVLARNTGPALDGDVSPWLLPAAAALMAAGAADTVSGVFRNTILQSATPDAMRGRLQGIFIVVVAGGPRLGDAVAGGNGEWLGEGMAALAGGLACVLVVGLLHRLQPRFARYDDRHPEP